MLILLIILCVLTAGLFPLDLFVVPVPEWVIFAMLAAIAAVTVLLFVRGRSKRPAKVVSVCLAAVTALTALGGIYLDPYFNSWSLNVVGAEPTLRFDTVLTADAARADLDYAMKFLQKNHPALMDGLPADMRQAYEQTKADIKAAGSVTVNGLARMTERIFAMLHDAHTSVFVSDMPLYLKHYYKWKQGDWTLIALNGLTIRELLDRTTDIYSYEAESWHLEDLKNDLLSLRGLDYLGFDTDAGVEYTFESPDGEQRSETYYTDDFVTYHEYCVFNDIDIAAQDTTFVSYTVDEEKSLALLTLSECNYNSEYINCLREMFTEVKEKGIRNVAVDIRDNGGGNDMTAVEFIRYLDTDGYKYASECMRLGFLTSPRSADYIVNERYTDLTFTGKVWVLTSAGSFSSAMLFPQYIKDNGLGTLIGEPPGNDPNGCGEVTMFKAPNSGIRLSISCKQFFRADRDCPDKYVMPDIPCDGDKALDTLYEIIA